MIRIGKLPVSLCIALCSLVLCTGTAIGESTLLTQWVPPNWTAPGARVPKSVPQEPAPIVASPPSIDLPPVPGGANHARAASLLADVIAILDDFDGSPELTMRVMTNLEMALRLNPREPRTYVEHARLTMKTTGLGSPSLQRSEEWLRRAIAIDPQSGDAYVLLGYVLTHADKLPDADAAFTAAQRMARTTHWLDANLAELRAKQQRYDEALELYRRAYKSPDIRVRLQAADWLGEHLSQRGAVDEAEDVYKFIVSIRPSSAGALINYGTFLRMHRLDVVRSEGMLRQALSISNFVEARKSLARTLYLRWADEWARDRNSPRAAQLFDEAFRLDPDMKELIYEAYRYPRVHPIIDAMAAKGYTFDTSPSGPSGTTPLEFASSRGNVEIVEALMRNGANPNTQGYRGQTGLMQAAAQGDTAMVRLLLRSGADPSLINIKGEDAEAYALQRGHHPLAGLLADAKRKYVRNEARASRSVPLRVGYAYRVKKDWKREEWSGPDARFTAGEIVVFDHATRYSPEYVLFSFKGKLPHFQQFSTPNERVGMVSEFFEEIGPSPRP